MRRGSNNTPWERRALAGLVAAVLVGAGCSTDGGSADRSASTVGSAATSGDVATDAADRSWYILPPGNYGGVPVSEHSLDQLPLYDGLTPLRGVVSDADIEDHFLPQDLTPVGDTTEEPTGRDGVTILYDAYGIPHIIGETREDMAFGAGWVTARDRSLLIELGRGPAAAAVADIPGIVPRELMENARSFEPSEPTKQLVQDQLELLVEEYGDEGQQVVDDAAAYAAGANAYWASIGKDVEPATAAEVLSTSALIGSIFGQGGGSEPRNAELLDELQQALGDERGQQAWEDLLPSDDPEAPTTIEETFDYPTLTGGEVTGSVVLDAGSVQAYEVVPGAAAGGGLVDAAAPPPDRKASNWLMVSPKASVNGTALGVMGPQIGYTYPEIVQQIHLSGPGIEAQGAAVPGMAMYLLVGRTPDYAWSLTSAGHDVRDVYVEALCEPDGSAPTTASQHYEHDGECIAFGTFDAGILDGTPVSYLTTVHGPVIGTATTDGAPVALSRKRSTFGRDALNLIALKRMTEGAASTPDAFFDTASQFEFTFNWGWVGREGIAFFSSGRLPERPGGLDRRLPTRGTGDYEWTGFLTQEQHPQADGHPSGHLLNWNNQSAPGFVHGDGGQHGSVWGVERFDEWPDRVDLAGVVSVMNRAATEDPLSLAWPSVSAVLAGSDAPTPRAQAVVDLLDAWEADDAPILDADGDGRLDSAGPTILAALWEPMVTASIEPVFGAMTDSIYESLGLNGMAGASLLDKDLRTLLGEGGVEGRLHLDYCGAGDLARCQAALWAVIDGVAAELSTDFASDDPATWLADDRRMTFVPGLIPETLRYTDRPTFQQLVELTQTTR